MKSTGMQMGRRAAMWLGVALGAALMLGPAMQAEEPGSGPARAVRLSNVEGQVQLSQGGEVVADTAVANTPLFEGAQVTTGNDGRAEVQFEDGSVARISPDSSLTLAVLKTGGDTEVVLNSGLGYFELQGGGTVQMRVRFGSAMATATGFTVLRVTLDQPPGELAVFSGNAHLEGAGSAATDLHGGESVALIGPNAGELKVAEAIEPNSWDAWNADRDQALTAAEAGTNPAAQGTANGNNPAWGDLNQNGTWYNVPDQGYVWSPYDAANSGWDPYSEGYWVASPQYGYMWVSSYSWGYLPYQCGLWNYYGGFGWGWAPQNCNTWWGGGGGWGFNVGYYPTWYRLPLRPGPPRPRNPRPEHGLRGRAVGPAPVIAVNRRLPGENTMLPSRDRNTSVSINGHVIMPVAIEPSRPVYAHMGTRPGNGAIREGERPGYVRPSGGSTARPGLMFTPPPRTTSGGAHPAPAPVARPSSGGSHPSSSGGSHPSSSGGGHPSGGGGGGGGHPSGGGGGSSHK